VASLQVQVDPPPHVLQDEIGLKLVAPDDAWRNRPDMSPFTRPFRASIVARARFIDEVVAEQADRGVPQYVILGAELDTFAQRRPELASRLLVVEVDRPGPQAWKRKRLIDLGFGIPSFLRFVPVDFETGKPLWERLEASGFNARRPAVVTSTGVSMYLTKDAITTTLRHVAALASGSTLVMSFALRSRRSRQASRRASPAGRA
jgi:methyltransferase (TIGR00027 family)